MPFTRFHVFKHLRKPTEVSGMDLLQMKDTRSLT